MNVEKISESNLPEWVYEDTSRNQNNRQGGLLADLATGALAVGTGIGFATYWATRLLINEPIQQTRRVYYSIQGISTRRVSMDEPENGKFFPYYAPIEKKR